jgi:hypothetical protein
MNLRIAEELGVRQQQVAAAIASMDPSRCHPSSGRLIVFFPRKRFNRNTKHDIQPTRKGQSFPRGCTKNPDFS